MSVQFGSAEPLYEYLLEFCSLSPTRVTHEGEEYTIYHSQFASYNLQKLFDLLIQQDADPLSGELNFSNQATQALEDSNLQFAGPSHSMQNLLEMREYIKPTDFSFVVQEYELAASKDDARTPFEPAAETRPEAIAEIITLYLADEASMMAEIDVGHNAEFDSLDFRSKQREKSELKTALFTVANAESGVLTQPDPSVQTVREIFEMLDAVNVEPDVRTVYGLFTSTESLSYFKPDDAVGTQMKTSFANAMSLTGDALEKWASIDEPPVDTLRDE